MSAPSLTPSSSFGYAFTYDVFISFRGTDTRYGFTGNLYQALYRKGIHTFFDDKELWKGEGITPSLLKAIEESRIAIVVFSKNYASSSFCLVELVKIMECIKGKGRWVFPVFYDVDPSDVRHQKGSYREALTKHEERFKDDMEKLEKVQKWRAALHQAANLSGNDFKLEREYEHAFIEKIVKEISNRIARVPLHVADYPVGLESRVLKVNSLLNGGSNRGAHMLGIYGVGGIGKTTIAKAVYNLIADQFEGLCFLENVREKSIKHDLAYLQEMVLCKILGEKAIQLTSVSEGISLIKQRFKRKKVLLVLDDVHKLEQLQAIAGSPNWFDSGSIIIITTRDKHLLASHMVERTYQVKEYDRKEALELFMWNAFKCDNVDPSYVDISNKVVSYASGLPLALVVIGSNLYGKSVQEWISALEEYKKIPNEDIQSKLKVSFDALSEYHKNIFLDIACCFKGYHLEEVENILHAHHDVSPKLGISVLVEKCLINIDMNGYVTQHDLIQDMGQEIVRQESPKDPGKRSRLWLPEDVIQVLQENTGTSEVELIILEAPMSKVIEWDGEAFKMMEFVDLSVLDFSWNYWIKHIPDVSGAPNLKELCFEGCENLVKIDESVGFLGKLIKLNVECCTKLRNLPSLMLPSLRYLFISTCYSLESFPEILGKMENIRYLYMVRTSIRELPYSICNLTRLKELSMESFENVVLPSSIFKFRELGSLRFSIGHEVLLSNDEEDTEEESSVSCSTPTCLDLFHCNLSDNFLGIFLARFPNVQELKLSHCDFTILPACIKNCHFLRILDICYCENLKEIRGIPPKIEELDATGSTSLSCWSRELLLNKKLHEEVGKKKFILPGTSIPSWYEHQSSGQPISLWFRNQFPAISLSFLFKEEFETHGVILPQLKLVTNGNQHESLRFPTIFDYRPGHISIYDLEDIAGEQFQQNEWNQAVVYVSNSYEYFMRRQLRPEEMGNVEIGVHIIKERSSMNDIQFTNSLLEKEDHNAAGMRGYHNHHINMPEKRGRELGLSLPEFGNNFYCDLFPHFPRSSERASQLARSQAFGSNCRSPIVGVPSSNGSSTPTLSHPKSHTPQSRISYYLKLSRVLEMSFSAFPTVAMHLPKICHCTVSQAINAPSCIYLPLTNALCDSPTNPGITLLTLLVNTFDMTL
ncbi:hypothetical protein AHAS_Ahas15G0375200 [Arachis hypogaea]